MRHAVKAPLRPFEYMAWAHSVPRGARYDLTASGVSDRVLSESDDEPWSDSISVEQLCRRDVQDARIDEFIRVVATRYDTEPQCVTPTLGASLAITHVLLALVRAGDHVIVERPTYEALHRVPEILGASVSRIERKYDEGWRVMPERLAKLLTSRTRVVVLSNLHNPSGVATDSDTLAEIADLAGRVGATVLVDEAYLDFCFEPGGRVPWRPAAMVADNAVSWSSSTKCFGFSAVRAGWIVARDPDIARAVRATADYLHVHVPVSTAELGTAVIRNASSLAARAREIAAAGRRTVERWIESESRLEWIPPTGGISAAIRLPNWLQDLPFALHLRERYDTQVVPGSMFEAPGFIRLSFGIEPGKLEQGLANVSAALDDLA